MIVKIELSVEFDEEFLKENNYEAKDAGRYISGSIQTYLEKGLDLKVRYIEANKFEE